MTALSFVWVHPYFQNSRCDTKNTEKYLSFSAGCVLFKDSYQFLSESLAILVQNLMDKGPDHFVYINKFIKDDEQ